MDYRIVRPELSGDQWTELQQYLLDHWQRAVDGRTSQVDSDYTAWDKNYRAIPKETRRVLPWPGASNFVVPVIRIFLDTFVARTLNIIFSTRPLITVEGFPREQTEALQLYLERKAIGTWQYYRMTRDLIQRGNKNGTAVVKTTWVRKDSIYVSEQGNQQTEETVVNYLGPQHSIIPFEDLYVYPITAENPEEVVIWFHRVRYVEETAKRLYDSGKWQMEPGELDSALQMPADVKKESSQNEAGVTDSRLKELQAVECHLDWQLGSKYYSVVAVIIPQISKLVDVQFNSLPSNQSCFTVYRPYPRESLFFGESMCQILAQLQEETTTIHNDRRNNSYISNAPVFKRRSGSLVPNPSTNWYPGKVWDVEDMTDFEVMQVGRNYDDMMQQETYGMQLGERLIGIGAAMQGYASGMMGKRGIYNASGTLALLSESNQRQDTNIKDVREVVGSIAKLACSLQAAFDPNDAMVEVWPAELRSQVLAALSMANAKKLEHVRFVIKASNAGANKEVERQNMMQMLQILGQYGAAVQQLAQQLVNPQLNQGLRLIINDILRMHKWMASRVLRAWDEHNIEEILPDAKAAINAVIPGGGAGTAEAAGNSGQGSLVSEGSGEVGTLPSRQELAAIASLPIPTQ